MYILNFLKLLTGFIDWLALTGSLLDLSRKGRINHPTGAHFSPIVERLHNSGSQSGCRGALRCHCKTQGVT